MPNEQSVHTANGIGNRLQRPPKVPGPVIEGLRHFGNRGFQPVEVQKALLWKQTRLHSIVLQTLVKIISDSNNLSFAAFYPTRGMR